MIIQTMKATGRSCRIPQDRSRWCREAGMESFRVFCSADNLYLFSHLDGMDPQYNFSGNVDYTYAPNKTIAVGVDINF